ncbi:MAG: hypothetical protein II220_08520 [Spirochaetales bacterium]|nr:hypothetical protein [Spirochaetales bacterium]
MKRVLLFLISFILIFNSFFYFVYADFGGGGSIDYSDESSGNKEGGGNDTDNYTNTFWYGKVEDVDGKFGISICVNYFV